MAIPKWLIPILLRFLPEKILGFSTALLLSNAPEIIEAGRVISGVIEKLQGEGKTEEQAAKATAEMIAKKRDMTFEEEQAWMNRSGSPG